MRSRLSLAGKETIVLAALTTALASPAFGQGQAPGAPAPAAEAGPAIEEGGAERPPPWQFQPTVGLTETFTDNAAGVGASRTGTTTSAATSTAKGTDLISRLSPGFRLLHDGNRGQLTFGYTASYDKYLRNSELDGLRHDLLGFGSAEIARDLLFLNASASVSEEVIDARGPTSATNRAIDGNEATTASFLLSPTLRSRLGGGLAVGELRYNYGFTSAGGSGTSSGQNNLIGARLSSGSDFQLLTWGLTVETSETSGGANTVGGLDSDTKRRLARLDNGYVVNRYVTLLAGFGYEEVENPTLSGDRKGLIYNAGVDLTPGPRTKLRVTYNNRYDSNFAEVDGTYALTDNSSVRVTYGETITTEQEQRFSNLANISRNVDGSLVDRRTGLAFTALNPGFGTNNGFGDGAFRQKRGTVGLNWGLSNVYNALLSYEDRVGETTLASQTSYSASFGFSRPLSEFTSFGSSFSYQRLNDEGATAGATGSRVDNTYRATASYNYDLGPTVRSSLSYAFAYRDSSDIGSDHENSITLRLTKTF